MACEKHEYYYLFWHTVDELFQHYIHPIKKILLKKYYLNFSLYVLKKWISKQGDTWVTGHYELPLTKK